MENPEDYYWPRLISSVREARPRVPRGVIPNAIALALNESCRSLGAFFVSGCDLDAIRGRITALLDTLHESNKRLVKQEGLRAFCFSVSDQSAVETLKQEFGFARFDVLFIELELPLLGTPQYPVPKSPKYQALAIGAMEDEFARWIPGTPLRVTLLILTDLNGKVWRDWSDVIPDPEEYARFVAQLNDYAMEHTDGVLFASTAIDRGALEEHAENMQEVYTHKGLVRTLEIITPLRLSESCATHLVCVGEGAFASLMDTGRTLNLTNLVMVRSAHVLGANEGRATELTPKLLECPRLMEVKQLPQTSLSWSVYTLGE